MWIKKVIHATHNLTNNMDKVETVNLSFYVMVEWRANVAQIPNYFINHKSSKNWNYIFFTSIIWLKYFHTVDFVITQIYFEEYGKYFSL